MANPFPFVAGAVLTAAQMNGIGEALTFTPTYTNFSLGNGTVNARYVRVQKLVYVSVNITCGTTSAFTGSRMEISKPVTSVSSSAGALTQGWSNFSDASTGDLVFGPVRYASTTVQSVDLYNTAGTYAALAFTNVTVPFTLATGDVIGISYVYEAA
jgi:hypothetical protein